MAADGTIYTSLTDLIFGPGPGLYFKDGKSWYNERIGDPVKTNLEFIFHGSSISIESLNSP